MPGSIVDKSSKVTQHIVHKDYALRYGASEYTKDRLNERAQAIAASPMDVHTLLRAVEYLTADNPEKIEFTLQHARKRILIEKGELKDDTVVRDYR